MRLPNVKLMRIRLSIVALALVICFTMTAFAQGPKNHIVEPTFPTEDMSGSEILNEVRSGVYGDQNLSTPQKYRETLGGAGEGEKG